MRQTILSLLALLLFLSISGNQVVAQSCVPISIGPIPDSVTMDCSFGSLGLVQVLEKRQGWGITYPGAIGVLKSTSARGQCISTVLGRDMCWPDAFNPTTGSIFWRQRWVPKFIHTDTHECGNLSEIIYTQPPNACTTCGNQAGVPCAVAGTCRGQADWITYPSSGCITGLFFRGPCGRSDAFISRCDSYDDEFCTCPGGTSNSPIVIDVDHSGFSMTDAAGGVIFDIFKDGVPLQMSWTAAGSTNAFLVLDRNGNGTIDNGEELFGNITPQPAVAAPHGFLALAEYDRPGNGGNGNRKMDRHDAIFSQLRLWQDGNHNGISESYELRPLVGLIRAIDLDYKESRRVDQHGNQFRYRSKVFDVHGAHAGRWAWDVFFKAL